MDTQNNSNNSQLIIAGLKEEKILILKEYEQIRLEYNKLLALAQDMRAAQEAYFQHRIYQNLIVAQQAERLLDTYVVGKKPILKIKIDNVLF